jgi:hypothetical protein
LIQQLGNCLVQHDAVDGDGQAGHRMQLNHGDGAVAAASAASPGGCVELLPLVQNATTTMSALYGWGLGTLAGADVGGRMPGGGGSSSFMNWAAGGSSSYSQLLPLLQIPQQMVELWGRKEEKGPSRDALGLPGEAIIGSGSQAVGTHAWYVWSANTSTVCSREVIQ